MGKGTVLWKAPTGWKMMVGVGIHGTVGKEADLWCRMRMRNSTPRMRIIPNV
jgi:hypothetical protein